MKKTLLTTTLSLALLLGLNACASDTKVAEKSPDGNYEAAAPEPDDTPIEEESPLGNYSGLVGTWTIDAATAGLKTDFTFNEDGSFHQLMGQIDQTGTWEIVDDTHIKVTTKKGKGKNWRVTDLNTSTVDICWNPDSPKPKTLHMQRSQ